METGWASSSSGASSSVLGSQEMRCFSPAAGQVHFVKAKTTAAVARITITIASMLII
ncbi:hypothetical protein D3C72_2391600 [compost metagenome]